MLCLVSPGREQGNINFLHPAKCKTTFALVLAVIVEAIRGWWQISGWGNSLMRFKGIWAAIPGHHCTLGYELRSFCLLLVENTNSLLHPTDTSQGYTWWELKARGRRLAPCNVDREVTTFLGGLLYLMCGVKTTYSRFLAYCGNTLSFPLLAWTGAHFFSEGEGVENVVLFLLLGSCVQGTSQNSDVPCSRMLGSPFFHSFWTVWVHEYPSQVSSAWPTSWL